MFNNLISTPTFIRTAAVFVTGATTYSLSKAVILNNTPDDEDRSRTAQAGLAIATGIVAMMVAENAAEFVDTRLASITAAWAKGKSENKTENTDPTSK